MYKNNTKKCKFVEADLGEYAYCDFLTKEHAVRAKRFVQTLEDYQATPLVSLDSLA